MGKVDIDLRIPDRLYKAVELALSDLEAVSQDLKYVIDMDGWHKPSGDGRHCHVCLAGVIMANTLGVDPKAYAGPYTKGDKWQKVFHAINFIRSYDVAFALGHFYSFDNTPAETRILAVIRKVENTVNKISYAQSKDIFISNMKRIAEILKEYDL